MRLIIALAAALVAMPLDARALSTFEVALTDQGGGDAGLVTFAIDETGPLVAPISSALPAGTVFFLVEEIVVDVQLDALDLGIPAGGGTPVALGDRFPELAGGFTLGLDSIREDGIAFLPSTTGPGGFFIEASPATAFAFADIALFTWSFDTPLDGVTLVLDNSALVLVDNRPPGPGEAPGPTVLAFGTTSEPAPAPVPLPATAALLLAALAGLAGLSRGAAVASRRRDPVTRRCSVGSPRALYHVAGATNGNDEREPSRCRWVLHGGSQPPALLR